MFLEKNCLQDMGLNDGSLTQEQIHISSVFRQQINKFGKSGVLLHSESGWKPATNSMQEHVMVKIDNG